MKREEWRPVRGAPYAVSSLGRVKRTATSVIANGGVRSKAGRILRPRPTVGGRYLHVFLQRRGYVYVHRLVAEAFHGRAPSPRHIVHHRNNKGTDNRATNLRWATKRKNALDAMRPGWGRQKLTHRDKVRIRALRRRGILGRTIADRFGITTSHVYAVARKMEAA